MSYYIEFQGSKLGQRSYRSYQEAWDGLLAISLECVESFKQRQKDSLITRNQQMELQGKILSLLKIAFANAKHTVRRKRSIGPILSNVKVFC